MTYHQGPQGLDLPTVQALTGMSAVELEEAARRDRVARHAAAELEHRWHMHFSFSRHPVSARSVVRWLRVVGAGHAEVKRARDLMRREEKAEARRLVRKLIRTDGS